MVFIHSSVKRCLDLALSKEAAVACVLMVAGFRPVNSCSAGNGKSRDRQREDKEKRDE